MQQDLNEVRYFRDYFSSGTTSSKTHLTQIVDKSVSNLTDLAFFSGNASKIGNIAGQVDRNGVDILSSLLDSEVSFAPVEMDIMRIIVATDGTRPSYPVNNGVPVTNFKGDSFWKTITESRAQALTKAIRCTGKITVFNLAAGSGFLVAPNIVMTNRHVLQNLTTEGDRYSLLSDVFIDFGCENKTTDTALKAKITKVIYPGQNEITTLNHRYMDMALVEIEPVNNLPEPIKLDTKPASSSGTEIFLIGFPDQSAIPRNAGTVYRDFFAEFMGYKKVAPGTITTSLDLWAGRFSHDASTLRGNSGSMVVTLGSEEVAVGLHYGGVQLPSPENWAHGLHLFCNPENEVRSILNNCGAQYV